MNAAVSALPVADIEVDPERATLEARMRLVDSAQGAVRDAVTTIAGVIPFLPGSDELLLTPEIANAWRILRDQNAELYLLYRSVIRSKAGRAVVDLLDVHIGPPRSGPSRNLVLLTPLQMCNLPMPADLVEGFLPSQGIGVVYGGPGAGKSAFVEHVINSLGTGATSVAGRRSRPCASLVIAAEGNRRARVSAWCQHHGANPRHLRVRYVQQGVDLRAAHGDIDQVLLLLDRIEGELGALGVVVIDTLARTFGGGSENDSADMGAYLSNLQRIAERTGGLVLVIHHAGKDTSKGARGHGSLLGAADAEIFVDRNDDLRTATVTKLRDGADGAEFSYTLQVVDLGAHPDPEAAADGKRLTSIVVEPSGDEATASRPSSARMPAGAKVALDALRSAIARHGSHLPGMAMTDRNKVVDVEQWREAFEQMRPIAGDDADARKAKQARRMAFNRAQDQLQSARIAGTNNGKWWVQ